MPEIKSPDLQVNQPIEGKANDPTLVIIVDAAKPLTTGTYVFQLQVVDDAKNVSQPTTVNIVVADDKAPNAVITGPARVSFGDGFTLSGKSSFDVGGRIDAYIWSLIKSP
jgi:hypothetical protein